MFCLVRRFLVGRRRLGGRGLLGLFGLLRLGLLGIVLDLFLKFLLLVLVCLGLFGGTLMQGVGGRKLGRSFFVGLSLLGRVATWRLGVRRLMFWRFLLLVLNFLRRFRSRLGLLCGAWLMILLRFLLLFVRNILG